MGDLERVFRGLSDGTRLRILNLLMHGELCVCDIQYVLDSPQPNVSRHLTYLKHSGLVLDRREGARTHYRLARPGSPLHKRLFLFLRDVFRASDVLREDSRRLRRTIGTGTCTVSEWHPYSALSERVSSRV